MNAWTDRLVQAARNALADLQGIMPEHDPNGERAHPGWTTIEELEALDLNAPPKAPTPS